MRPLTRNEKFLLGILAVIVFLGGNLIGYRELAKSEAANSSACLQLRAEVAEAKVTLSSQPEWDKRQEWISHHEPVVRDEGDAKAQTLNFVLTAAREKGLQITEQKLDDSVEEAGGFQVQITLSIRGPMEALTRWLAQVQDPSAGYAIPSVSVKVADDSKTMACTLHLCRYFKLGKT